MLNVKLLRAVKAHILEEPRRFIMDSWRENGAPGEHLSLGCDIPRKLPACGTAACICGWACLIANNGIATHLGAFCGLGPEVLGIPGPEVNNSLPSKTQELFYVNRWPKSYQKSWHKTRSLRKRAEIAGRRIDAYIREYGPKKHDK